MNDLVIDHEPFDMDREIAAIVAERLPIIRAREKEADYRAACWQALRDDIRFRRQRRAELPILCALTFSITVGVACIAEMRLAGWL